MYEQTVLKQLSNKQFFSQLTYTVKGHNSIQVLSYDLLRTMQVSSGLE